MSGKKPFKPLGEDLDDLAERVAASKNIPTLTPPAPIREEGRGFAVPPPRAPNPSAARTIAAGSHIRPIQPSTPASRTQIRLRCPNHICDQLASEQQRLRQEGQRVTINYLILLALRAAGYRVDDRDLIEDGRRLR